MNSPKQPPSTVERAAAALRAQAQATSGRADLEKKRPPTEPPANKDKRAPRPAPAHTEPPLSPDSSKATPPKSATEDKSKGTPEKRPVMGQIKAQLRAKLRKIRSALQRLLPFMAKNQVAGQDTRELSASAIKHQVMLRVRYEGNVGYLDFEPHALGRDTGGRLMLYGYEVKCEARHQTSEGWRRLELSKLVSAVPTGVYFEYRKWSNRDAGFKMLLARVSDPNKDSSKDSKKG